MNRQVRLPIPAQLADAFDAALRSGDRILLTRAGSDVAEVRPITTPSEADAAAAIERLLLRSDRMPKVSTEEILDWISEGRT